MVVEARAAKAAAAAGVSAAISAAKEAAMAVDVERAVAMMHAWRMWVRASLKTWRAMPWRRWRCCRTRGAVMSGATAGAGIAPKRRSRGRSRIPPIRSIGKAARLSGDAYRKAADLFRAILTISEEQLRPDAPWEAFALQRLGGESNQRAALEALAFQQREYPRAATRGMPPH